MTAFTKCGQLPAKRLNSPLVRAFRPLAEVIARFHHSLIPRRGCQEAISAGSTTLSAVFDTRQSPASPDQNVKRTCLQQAACRGFFARGVERIWVVAISLSLPNIHANFLGRNLALARANNHGHPSVPKSGRVKVAVFAANETSVALIFMPWPSVGPKCGAAAHH